MVNLFTYGSLMFSDIMHKVSECQPSSTKAVLKDYFCSKIRNEEYPGIIPRPGAQVTGILYFNLPPKAIQRLNSFEGALYVRQDVEVIVEKHEVASASAYIFKPEYRHLLTGEAWNSDQFLSSGKARFEKAYLGFKSI